MPAAGPDIVVLLHGIGHSRLNMLGMEFALARRGFTVLNISYPSTRLPLSEIARTVDERLHGMQAWQPGRRVHIVAHSMGGLVAQSCLEHLADDLKPRMGRLVMLGTPNGGSEVADLLKDFPPYRWLFGPAGQELTSLARQAAFAPAFYEIGIIAGTSGRFYPLAHRIVPWKTPSHDGRVTVESTRCASMKDHISLPVTHGLMAWSPSVQKQTIHFLNHGAFQHV